MLLINVFVVLAGFGGLLPSLCFAADEISVELPGGATIDMVWIESGTFMMGLPPSDPHAGNVAYIRQHQVTISKGFYLGKYEFTRGQWEGVMNSRPWGGSLADEDPNLPAAMVSWFEVNNFIHRLNEASGDSLFRLPTEAEWEYACRAGTQTLWSFGDEENRLESYAWYSANYCNADVCYLHPVGGKLPNPWGLYDMYGNAWEWCQDWLGPYEDSSQVDPQGPNVGSERVIRGANYGAVASMTISAYRAGRPPGAANFTVGARIVRNGPQITAITPQGWGQVKKGTR